MGYRNIKGASSSIVIGSIIVGIQMYTIFFFVFFFRRSFISTAFNLFCFFYSSFHLLFSLAFRLFLSFSYFLSIYFTYFVFIVTFFPTLENSIQVNFRLVVRKQSEALNVISSETIACLNSASIPACGEVCPNMTTIILKNTSQIFLTVKIKMCRDTNKAFCGIKHVFFSISVIS